MGLKLSNNAASKISSGISATDVTLSVIPGDGAKFPALANGDWFPGTLIKQTGESEIVRVTGRASDTFTIVRAQESTAALAFSAGDRFELRLTSMALQELQSHAPNTTPTAANLDKTINLRSLYTILDLLEPVGTVKYWDSDAPPPPGYFVCDGTNGTPDWRGRFIVVAGPGYARGATGGAETVTLTAAQMPTHNHGVNDPGHVHPLNDPGHAHNVYDPGHSHSMTAANNGGASPSQINASFTSGPYFNMATNPATTGIGIYPSGTGITMGGQFSNISIQNAGNGQAHENRPPYVAIPIIRKMVTALSTLG